MMQAVYSPENVGHYGLGTEHYLHFTSPIRRYPDLMVHRLLKEEWARRHGGPARRTGERELEEIAALSSERERASMEAEREIASFYAALFMQDKVGERFRGVVSAVTEFGFFVELERWFVEGLVRADELGGALELDPVQHALVDRASGRAFRVGDEVEVELLSASPARRRIDLKLLGEAAEALGEAERPAAAGAERGRGPVRDRGADRRGQGRGGARSDRGGGGGERERGAGGGRERGGAGGGRERGERGGGAPERRRGPSPGAAHPGKGAGGRAPAPRAAGGKGAAKGAKGSGGGAKGGGGRKGRGRSGGGRRRGR
jgi:ribonuclease R